MKLRIPVAIIATVTFTVSLAGCRSTGTVTVGIMYPTAGAQGVQGAEEKAGAQRAAEWVNAHGGVAGRRLRLVSADLVRAEGVPSAMAALQRAGVSVVVGTHGSTFSAVAAAEATRRHMLVWETGAVGELTADTRAAVDFVRMAPMGGDLGRAAVDFVRDGLPHPAPLRWAVAYVDDPYGRAVSLGAASEVRATGQPLVGMFPYNPAGDFAALAARIAASGTEALYVAAYLNDGLALRRALVAAHVPLVVNLGTSSSYCMPAFGTALGASAVGVFASDKPDVAAVRPSALLPEGRAALAWATARGVVTSHGLSGFSNAYALFAHVLPRATAATAEAVAAAAQVVKLPVGTLANGGGLDIAPAGAPDAGNNRLPAGVIWEWVAPGREEVVWPPAFATHAVAWMPIDR